MEDVTSKKICAKCHQEKPLEEFSKDKHQKSGHRSQCKDCCKQYREADRENLTYVKGQIQNKMSKLGMKISRSQIPDHVIEMERVLIDGRRRLKDIKLKIANVGIRKIFTKLK